jgi:hypothetical protein
MSFLKDDKQEFRLSDLNIIGNPDSIFKTADFVNNKEPFGKIPLQVDYTVSNEYYTKLYNDIKTSLKQPVGYITMSKQELQEMLKPFTATVAYDEKSHTVVSRGNVRFLHPNDDPQRAPITSYPVVDFKWKASELRSGAAGAVMFKHDQKSITDILTMSRKAGGKIIELVNNETLLDNYPLIIPIEAISKARDIIFDRTLNEELVEEVQVVYLGFISFGVYYPEQPVVFKIKGKYYNGYFPEEVDDMIDGISSHVPMPLLLAYNLPDGVYSYRSNKDKNNFMLFIGGMCQKNISVYEDTHEDIDNYINGEITEAIHTRPSKIYSNRHVRCEIYRWYGENDISSYREYDSEGQNHGVAFHRVDDISTSILTYKHGELNGPFELRNSTQGQDFLVIGTFGNFQGPPYINSFTRNNLPTLHQYVVGKFFESLNNSGFISVIHFNEKHQLNGIYEIITNVEGYNRQIIANRGEMYSSGNIIVLRQYYIENREVTKKEYTAYITKLREGIATIAKGKDVESIIESYL